MKFKQLEMSVEFLLSDSPNGKYVLSIKAPTFQPRTSFFTGSTGIRTPCYSPPPPSPVVLPPVSKARKDPHFHFAHGGRADIRGEAGAVYNLLSAKNVPSTTC